MTEATTMERHRRHGTAVRELDSTLAREVEAVIEQAERAEPQDGPEVRQWFYRVPQAGVRYYSF